MKCLPHNREHLSGLGVMGRVCNPRIGKVDIIGLLGFSDQPDQPSGPAPG